MNLNWWYGRRIQMGYTECRVGGLRYKIVRGFRSLRHQLWMAQSFWGR